jgi:hypothetical protein
MKRQPASTGLTTFNSPRTQETLEARQRARRTELNITCDTCGVSLYRVRGHVYRVAPRTHFKLAVQAMTKHIEMTGCAGHKLDFRKLDGALGVVALMESAQASGADVGELADKLGVPRETAAELMKGAISEIVGVKTPIA